MMACIEQNQSWKTHDHDGQLYTLAMETGGGSSVSIIEP